MQIMPTLFPSQAPLSTIELDELSLRWGRPGEQRHSRWFTRDLSTLLRPRIFIKGLRTTVVAAKPPQGEEGESESPTPDKAKKKDISLGKARALDALVWLAWHASATFDVKLRETSVEAVDGNDSHLASLFLPELNFMACSCSLENTLAAWGAEMAAAHMYGPRREIVSEAEGLRLYGDVARLPKRFGVVSASLKSDRLSVEGQPMVRAGMMWERALRPLRRDGAEKSPKKKAGKSGQMSVHVSIGNLVLNLGGEQEVQVQCKGGSVVRRLRGNDSGEGRSEQLEQSIESDSIMLWRKGKCHAVCISLKARRGEREHGASALYVNAVRARFEVDDIVTCAVRSAVEEMTGIIQEQGSSQTLSSPPQEESAQSAEKAPSGETSPLDIALEIQEDASVSLPCEQAGTVLWLTFGQFKGSLHNSLEIGLTSLQACVSNSDSMETRINLLRARNLSLSIPIHSSTTTTAQSSQQQIHVQVDGATSWAWISDSQLAMTTKDGALELSESIRQLSGALTLFVKSTRRTRKSLSSASPSSSASAKGRARPLVSFQLREIVVSAHTLIPLDNGKSIHAKLSTSYSNLRGKINKDQQASISFDGKDVTFTDHRVDSFGEAETPERNVLLLAVATGRVRETEEGENGRSVSISFGSIEGQYDVDFHLFAMHAAKQLKSSRPKKEGEGHHKNEGTKESSSDRRYGPELEIGQVAFDIGLSEENQVLVKAGQVRCRFAAPLMVSVCDLDCKLNGKSALTSSALTLYVNPSWDGILKHRQGECDNDDSAVVGSLLDPCLAESRKRCGCLVGDPSTPSFRLTGHFEKPVLALPEEEHLGRALHDLLMFIRWFNLHMKDANPNSASQPPPDPDSMEVGLGEMVFTFRDGSIQVDDSQLERSLRIKQEALEEVSVLERLCELMVSYGEEVNWNVRMDRIRQALSTQFVRKAKQASTKQRGRVIGTGKEGQLLLRVPKDGKQFRGLMQRAAEVAKSLDPPSSKVEMRALGAFNMDFLAFDTCVSLRECPPLVTSKAVAGSGPIINARQAFLCDLNEEMDLIPLGRHRRVKDVRKEKSKKAPAKFFTDIVIASSEVSCTYTASMDPTLADLSKDIQRTIVKGPVHSKEKEREKEQQKLSPWDSTRFFWRGRISALCDNLSIAALSRPPDHVNAPGALRLGAENVDVKWSEDGDFVVSAWELSLSPQHPSPKQGDLFPPPSFSSKGASLSDCEIVLGMKWFTRGGQEPSEHHLLNSSDASRVISMENFKTAEVEIDFKIHSCQSLAKGLMEPSFRLSFLPADITLLRKVIGEMTSPAAPLRNSFRMRRFGAPKCARTSRGQTSLSLLPPLSCLIGGVTSPSVHSQAQFERRNIARTLD